VLGINQSQITVTLNRDKRMKIAMIGPSAPFRGGISHYTTLLFQHLKNRHKVRFFAFKRQYPGWLFPGKTDIDPSLSPFAAPGLERVLDSMNPLTWIATAQKIVQSRCDLVILPWWVSFWAPQFLTILSLVKHRSNAKILFVCHNVVAHESRFFDSVLTRMVLKNGDFFIVHSREDEDNLRLLLPGSVIRRQFHPTYDAFNSTMTSETCRKVIDVTSPVLLLFGFVRDYKGLNYLIAAMPEILTKISATLLIVGEFWKDKAEYLKMIDDLGIGAHVKIVDAYVPNEDVGQYFNAADLVVQPYVSATGSGVVQVAFGLNKPVVATNVGSLSEIVKHGENGYLVPPKDSKAISRTVLQFFKDKNAIHFEENILKNLYIFSWDHLVDGIETLFPGI
jgi:glycosyltransferase involved in cell wall biosynthesis